MNKYFITPLKQRLSTLLVSSKKLDVWMEQWKFFFILGFGRSGTSFMANFLNQAEETYVFHEPVFEDFYAHARAHYSQAAAETYIEGFRKKEIYRRIQHLHPGIYGEVNGTLRCHVKAIQKSFPKVTLLHLVRDGRDVVRSNVGRRTMTIRNPFSMSMHPIASDPWSKKWSKMDRFARICWYWQEENSRLRKAIGRTVQFEKILSNYEYFSSEVLTPCGIQIDEKAWHTAVASPRNVTREFSMPKWDGWTSEQRNTFQEICGEEMANCGYSF